jgi:hypothetical protein
MSNASTVKSNASKKTVESVDDVKRKMSRPPSIHPGRLADVGGITPRYAKEFLERRLQKPAAGEGKQKSSAPPATSAAVSETESAAPIANDASTVPVEVDAAPKAAKTAAPALRQKPVIAQRTPSATQRLVPRALIGVAGANAVAIKRTPSSGKSLQPQTAVAAPKVEPTPVASATVPPKAADLPEEKATEVGAAVEEVQKPVEVAPTSTTQPEAMEATTPVIVAPLSLPSSRSASAAPDLAVEKAPTPASSTASATKPKPEVRVGRTLLPRTGGVNVNSSTGKKPVEPATSFGAIQTAVKPGAAIPPRKQSAGAVRRAPVIVQRSK